MQRITIIGNVGKDLDLKYTETRKKVVEFSVAVTEKINNNDLTTWFNCEARENRAEILTKYVKKGDQIYIEGKIRNKKYKGKDGQEKYYTYVLIEGFKLLKNEKKENNYNENNWSNEPDTSALGNMEDLEFY